MFQRNRIAETLRSAREKRGLSLEQAASDAGIPAQYVRLLEGESDVRVGVSDELYLIPFFRKYAHYVGIDAEEMLPEFLGMVHQMAGEGSPPIRLAYRPRYAWVWPPLAVVLTIAIAALLLLRQPREQDAVDEAAVDTGSESAEATAAVAQVTPVAEVAPVATSAPVELAVAASPLAASPVAPTEAVTPSVQASPAAGTVATGSHELQIAAKEEAWMSLALNDQPAKQYILKAGESRTWTADTFSLTVGNSGGVVLSLDGRELPPIGRSGRVVRNLRLPEAVPAPAPTGP